jgi:hypothetical protein
VAGASAAVLGASTVLAGTAGSQQVETTLPLSAPQPPIVPEAAGAAAEPVLIATFGGAATPVPTLAPQVLPAPVIDPSSGMMIEGVSLASTSTGTGTGTGTEPTHAPLPLTSVSAVSLVANVQEVAQASQPAPAAADTPDTFWPEGHWSDNSSSGSWVDGLVSMSATAGALAMIGGGGWLLWRYINTKPEFDDAIVYLSYNENPCGDAVYTAPGKDADGDDLTYSILAYDTDDSSLFSIGATTGEVTFINDPLFLSPGDLDRDGVYSFVIEVEDEDGHTATQAVELTILQSPPTAYTQPFIQNGGTVCGDEFEITGTSGSPSLFDIAGGSGNDLAQVTATVGNFGVDLGTGEDTLHVTAGADAQDLLVDLGDGRDTIELDSDVHSLVVQNFDADDLIYLDGGVITESAGLGVALYSGTTSVILTSQALAEAALAAAGGDQIAAYQNGEHSFLLVEDADAVATTIKLEDYILSDYSQIEVA